MYCDTLERIRTILLNSELLNSELLNSELLNSVRYRDGY